MTKIVGEVTKTVRQAIGFRCGLCHKNFRYSYGTAEYVDPDAIVGSNKRDASSMPVSCLGELRYFHPDGEGLVKVDLCGDCFYKLRDYVKSLGGVIENDG